MTDMSEYKETGMSWLPRGWKVQRLSALTKSFAGGTPSRSNPEYFGGDIPWVKSGEINLRKITKTEEYITEKALSASSAKVAESGAVLVAMYGATAGKVARLYIDAAINQAVLSIRACGNDIDNEFLFWLMESHTQKLLSLCQGAAQPNLSKGLIDGIEVAVPPLNEQLKIAAILTAVDDKLDIISRKIAATQALKQGLMQTLFSRGVGVKNSNAHWVPHTVFNNSELGEIPDLWEVKKISDVLNVIERPIKMADDQLYRRVTVKRRHGSVVLRDQLLGFDIKVKNQFLLETGDFLISERQIVHGACGIVPEHLAGALVSNEYLVLLPKEDFDINYFNYLVQTIKYAKLFFICSQGVDIEKFLFKYKDWFKQRIPVPPLAEQKRIADILVTTEQKIQALQNKLLAYQTLKRGLMQKLLTGEWRVKLDDSTPTTEQ